jgi:hypothetical protein
MTKRKEKDWYRLPNGKVVNDADEYIDAWRKLAKPIEKAFGLVHSSMDPNISFVDPNNRQYYIQLPMWFIERFNAFILENNKKIRGLGCGYGSYKKKVIKARSAL